MCVCMYDLINVGCWWLGGGGGYIDVNRYLNCNSKSEYIIYKLKEMEKIGEKDILQICDQFRKLDPNNCGKITLPDLLENHLWQLVTTKKNVHV